MTVSTVVVIVLVAVLAAALGMVVGYLLGLRRPADAQQFDAAISASQHAVAPVRASLDQLGRHLHDLEVERTRTDSQLLTQLHTLQRETNSLSTALRKPQVRGRWGELHLRRTAELAGMIAHCDFDEQVGTESDGQRLRPDMVVHLTGGRSVVVDSKVPLDAFLDATGTDDADEVDSHLQRHLRQIRTHVDHLSAKSYWSQFESTPEFVVMFVPGEAFLAAALDTDPGLIEHAAERRIVLATPSTLIALLRTVAFAWTQQSLAANAREIHRTARELHDRIGAVSAHFARLGSSLEKSVKSYNDAIGSLESRLIVTARRLTDLDVAPDPPETPKIIETTPRQLTAPELLDGLASKA